RVEDSLSFYRSDEVRNLLGGKAGVKPPPPVWVLARATSKDGPVITNWRWLADSSGVAFLEHEGESDVKLVLANLRTREVQKLETRSEPIKTFDVADRHHYVYTSADPDEAQRLRDKAEAERSGPAAAGTGA